MDRRTHEGLTTGTVVTLPGRPVHVGVWLRLLRTLLDEVNAPTSYVRPSSRTKLQQVWQTIGHPTRAGQTRWRPYESLSSPTQQAMLHAATAALHLMETGQVTARGSLGPALRAGPYPPVYDGDPPNRFIELDRPGNSWQVAIASLRDIARQDPQTARQLLALLTGFSRTQAGVPTRPGLSSIADPGQPGHGGVKMACRAAGEGHVERCRLRGQGEREAS